MTESTEIVIKYRQWPATALLAVLIFFCPLWAIILPLAGIGGVLGSLISGGIGHLWLSLAALCVSAMAVCLTIACVDDKIIVSEAGICFPLHMLPFLRLRREIPWRQLKACGLGAGSGKGERMFLRLYSGETVRFSLRSVTSDTREKLIQSFLVWAPQCQHDEKLLMAQDQYQHGPGAGKRLSYTLLWEDELARRFSSAAFVPLEPGTRLNEGALVIVRQLAFGGLSAVYLASHDRRQLVVVKEAVVPQQAAAADCAKAVEMFQREARLLSELQHPRIAKVLNHFVENDRHYLVIEQVPGQDLRQLVLQQGAQAPALCLDWAKQIAEILAYLHGQVPPVVHRDISPENLVLDGQGKIVLIDFGAANEFLGEATGTLVGKQAYISPEQFRGNACPASDVYSLGGTLVGKQAYISPEQFRGNACPASDVYSLGGTLFFLLTGQDPEPLSVSHPRELTAVGAALDELVARCTALEPEKRYADGQALFLALKDMRA